MKKKFDPIWRIIVAVALVLALVPVLAISVATPVGADVAGYVSTTADPNPFNPLVGSTTIEVTAASSQATIDGVMSLGEWDPATSYDLGGGYTGYVMTDGTYLYVAFNSPPTGGFGAFNVVADGVNMVAPGVSDDETTFWDSGIIDDATTWARVMPSPKVTAVINSETELKVSLADLDIALCDDIKLGLVLVIQGVGYTCPSGFSPFDLATYADYHVRAIQAGIFNAPMTLLIEVIELTETPAGSGTYVGQWDGLIGPGNPYPDGTYFVASRAGAQTGWSNPEPLVIDSIAPTMDSAETKTATTIDVTFSEDLDGGTVAGDGSDFSVEDQTVTGASESNGVVTLTLASLEGHETPQVCLVDGQSVADVAGNELAGPVCLVASDGIDPTLADIVEPACINAANVTAYTVTGTTEPFATVTVTLDDSTTQVTGTDVAEANGDFSVTLDASSLDDDPAIDKTIDAEDAAGNTATTVSTTEPKDTVAPVVTIVTMSGDPLDTITDSATPAFTGTATDASPSSGLTQPQWRVDGGSWTDTSGTPGSWNFTSSALTSGPHTVDVRATDSVACGNTGTDSHAFVVDLVPGPPVLLDAVTGWAWDNEPWNANSRTTIMVIYSEPLDPTTVTLDDYMVNGLPPLGREVRAYTFSAHTFGVVFLTVGVPMLTDAEPMVVQVGPVADYAGYHLDTAEVLCQDGIWPLITVTASPEMPGYNDLVTVTATASEDMSEAYIQVFDPTGTWPSKPTDPWNGTTLEEWLAEGWTLMSGSGTTWTYEFLYAYEPGDMVAVEVAGHDSSYYTDGWPVVAPVYPCFWKHEKWYQESYYFIALEKFEITLCEGWNLISVPGPLIDSSVQGVFDGTGVTYVYYYNPAVPGDWEYAIYDSTTGWRWINPYGMTIDHGKGYYVYCSPPSSTVTVWLTWFDQPPAYPLLAGWNLIGYTEFADVADTGTDMPILIKHYLRSLRDNAMVMYTYDPCGQYHDLGPGWIRWDAGGQYYNWSYGDYTLVTGFGFWLYLLEAGFLAP